MPESAFATLNINRLIEEWSSASGIAGPKTRPLNIVAIGAHPDDPETGCGGTLAEFARQGHNISILYLTRGEAGRRWETSTPITEPIADTRTREALQACAILGAKPLFAGQIDGCTTANNPALTRKFTDMLLAQNPDIVFTHWPMDSHSDHQNVAALTESAWEAGGRKFMLAYYEVMSGLQTLQFTPNRFVDIGAALETKREVIFAHACQTPARFFEYHVGIEEQRGKESGCARAEAFFVVPPHAADPFRPLRAARPISAAAEERAVR